MQLRSGEGLKPFPGKKPFAAVQRALPLTEDTVTRKFWKKAKQDWANRESYEGPDKSYFCLRCCIVIHFRSLRHLVLLLTYEVDTSEVLRRGGF